jgi:methylmalonyl-CoA mutase
MIDFTIANEFPPARREDWLALVDKALKGEPFDRLKSKTYDGLTIDPLYERAPHAKPIVGRQTGASWQVMQRVDHPDPAVANKQTLEDLEGGATGLSIVFAGSIGGHGYGIDASEAVIDRLLDGVHLDAISLEFDLSPQTKDAGAHLAAIVRNRGLATDRTDIRFGFDPLGAVAVAGGSPVSWKELVPIFGMAVRDLASNGFRGPFAVADGRVVHNAGGSEAQELAFVLATAVAYLRALETGGTSLDDARRMIFFRLSADADQFLTTAKFRALRKLWARVEEASGLGPRPIFVSAETAWRMMTRRDPYVNMLRATVAVAAAGFGGADAIGVLPFTAALGLPDRLARRIARNTQLILLEESNLAKVTDPAAGSGGIEDLTTRLCAAAWSLFQEIEGIGGMAAALEQGLIQRKIATVRRGREQAVADHRDLITGTTIFADPDKVPVTVLDVAPVQVPSLQRTIEFEPLTAMRLSEPYEVP